MTTIYVHFLNKTLKIWDQQDPTETIDVLEDTSLIDHLREAAFKIAPWMVELRN